MMYRNRTPTALLRAFSLLLMLATGLTPLAARDPQPDPLRVGTRDVPPFAMPTADGQWQGISIDLWRTIAERIDRDYAIRPMESVEEILEALAAGDLDVAVGAFSITAERERTVDFSHPFFVSGLSIAVVPRGGGILRSLIEGLFSRTFLTVIGGLVLVLGTAGLLVWLFERRRNPDQFGGSARRGIGEGFWWAAVTMTTVGYGDRAPATVGGRFVALIWMFASIIMISGFTAAIATSLTVQRLDTPIQGPEDLPGHRIGTLAGSTSESYLIRGRIAVQTFPSIPVALAALTAGAVDAVVYDGALLRYHVNNDFRGTVRVLPRTFEPQEYGIVVPPRSALREPVNQALLSITASDEWRAVLHNYLGAE